MNLRPSILLCALALASCAGPRAEPEARRPDQVMEFATLYSENCSACHGTNGKNGAAIALANPAYLAFAGATNVQRITAAGVPGSLMPPFARSSGGMLTDAQIAALAKGMIAAWGTATPAVLPAYASSLTGDAARGEKTYYAACLNCHSTNTLLDPDYLDLISDQGLRSFIVAGHAENHLNLNDEQVTDTVAWLASHRAARK